MQEFSKSNIWGMRQEFVRKIFSDISAGIRHNKLSVEKLAATFGITDKTEVKELTELAIVKKAREIVRLPESPEDRFLKIVALYEKQVNLSHRTSQSILLQQYSTPAPIAYLAGLYTRLYLSHRSFLGFEPSAGNGLLTIAGNPSHIIVNEIDDLRRSNLQVQGYKQVLKQDATQPFKDFYKKFDAVITNPPFGTIDHAVNYDGFGIRTLDHLMALRALDTMKDEGRAAIIIGGHTQWDEKGRVQAGKNRIFFNYLYSHYHVSDIILIDGSKLYSRQGTAFDVRLILIAGRKKNIHGVAPVKNKELATVINSFENLYNRVSSAMTEASSTSLFIEAQQKNEKKALAHEAEALALELELLKSGELGAPYLPASDSCVVLNTVVPDSMAFETQEALNMIRQAVGGDIDEFVRQRLGYPSGVELCKALSAEQIDAVAMAIYNIEARGQGMIIGDQTGIGKGRIAAAMIRYAVMQGYKPIFLTEKANLFSDLYRDLLAIGSGDLAPFIVNGKESKTDIKDEDGEIVYQALPPTEQSGIFKEMKVPGRFNFVLATYSQFNSERKKPEKPAFLKAIAEGNIIIMDESHNSSGSSNTGELMQAVIAQTAGVVFLSATFAKRPDNMPVYAMKTAISEANMSKEELVNAITHGGVALQEVLSSQLVAEGQMLRRERSFEGVEVNYITLEDKAQEHSAIADNITGILRDIIAFQSRYVDEMVDELDDIAVAEGQEVDIRQGTSQAGVDNQPYFSKVFNVINQMLFSIKAEAVAERAIMRLKEGKKPVIAFASTMGSFIEEMENQAGLAVGDGDTVNADFANVLQKGLDGIMRYTVIDANGSKTFKKFEVSELNPEAQAEYIRISSKIKSVSTGITISPIDVIVRKLTDAGYSVAEVTGRKYELQINPKTGMGMVRTRKKVNTNDAFRQFNNNETDVLMINQSGSTGASAHAIITPKVPASQVRQRVMIVLQTELDINTEVQKRGRINRTGQIYKPIYDYINSAIPAEKRLMMMLQKKLKSLDANTTSNQKQSTKILDVPDFLNKYGDRIVSEYLKENPPINKLLGDPLGMEKAEGDSAETKEDAAHKVSGRVAVLSTQMQQDFYTEISQGYNDYVEYLRQIGEYDLEVEAMNLEAETLSKKIIKVGKGGQNEFGDDSILEKVRANVLKKPFSRTDLDNVLTESLGGKEAAVLQSETLQGFEEFMDRKLEEETRENDEYYAEETRNIPNEKKIKKIRDKDGEAAYHEAIREKEKELEAAQEKAKILLHKTFSNRRQYLSGLFNFFYTGRCINYPVETFDKGQELYFSVFLGFLIDRKKKNPYAPSAIRLRFAISNSNKYVAIPASYTKDIDAIKGVSISVPEYSRDSLLNRWEEAIRESSTDRQVRYIVTGNLLQAFSDFRGKLVSYTIAGGGIKKGILLPEYWDPQDSKAENVIVPIERAFRIIASLGQGSQIHTNNGIAIFRHYNGFKILVPASRQKGGDIYLNEEILTLVEKNRFEKVADQMVANLEANNLKKLVEILQHKFNGSVSLSPYQFDMIKDDLKKEDHKQEGKVLKMLALHHPRQNNGNANVFELEALALELELELLNFAA